jgi:hypothetical protein
VGSADIGNALMALPGGLSRQRRRNDMNWTLLEETYIDEGNDVSEDLSNQSENDPDD